MSIPMTFRPAALGGGFPDPGGQGKPVVVDFSVAGIWLALEERDQFTSFLGQNNGSIHALIGHLSKLERQFRNR